MKHKLTALVAGFIFGIGLTISQMINPAKVIGFLDILGDWDPSLALVMIGALIITAIGYRLAWRRETPVFAERFQVPGNRQIDKRLATGATLFGVGWGLIGLCPGPAFSTIAIGGLPIIVFLGAMAVGMALVSFSDRIGLVPASHTIITGGD